MTNAPPVSIRDVPPRPTTLSDDALRGIFGGCGDACFKDSDCCGDDACIPPSSQGDMACQ